jgi:hypothetical protein
VRRLREWPVPFYMADWLLRVQAIVDDIKVRSSLITSELAHSVPVVDPPQQNFERFRYRSVYSVDEKFFFCLQFILKTLPMITDHDASYLTPVARSRHGNLSEQPRREVARGSRGSGHLAPMGEACRPREDVRLEPHNLLALGEGGQDPGRARRTSRARGLRERRGLFGRTRKRLRVDVSPQPALANTSGISVNRGGRHELTEKVTAQAVP